MSCDGWRALGLEKLLSFLEKGLLLELSLPDFAFILCRCKKEKDRTLALRLLEYLYKIGLEFDQLLGNHLVQLLVESGSLCDAEKVFHQLAYRNEWSWNSLITAYVKCGQPQDALTLHQKMSVNNIVHPSGHTFVALLKACAQLQDIRRGHQIHVDVARRGLLEKDHFLGSALVDMYARCGDISKAHQVFDRLPVRNVVMWNALIARCADSGHAHEAFKCYKQMQLEGFLPDAITFVCSLKAC
eukprot:c25778_g1_i1 orf=352-1080(+)